MCATMSKIMCKPLPFPPLPQFIDLKHLLGIFLYAGRPVSGICADSVCADCEHLFFKSFDYKLSQFQHLGVMNSSTNTLKFWIYSFCIDDSVIQALNLLQDAFIFSLVTNKRGIYVRLKESTSKNMDLLFKTTIPKLTIGKS